MSYNREIVSSHFGDNVRIHQGDVNNYHNCSQVDRNRCLSDLRVTDPQDDKTRIQESKGGLLRDSYRWVLDHGDFQQWRQPGSDRRFLWIRGDPGKGKTMLLCGIIDELAKEPNDLSPVVYFFCQASDTRINNATAVLRGLIYMLIKSRESLFVHVSKEYEQAGKQLFEDPNALTALSHILTAIVSSSELSEGVIIIDALDECVKDLQPLLELIVDLSRYGVRWIVSSRNWPEIGTLRGATQKAVLRLELNEGSIYEAVRNFITYKVQSLARQQRFDDDTKVYVQRYLESNCSDTFLWVALVCQILEDPKIRCRHVLSKLKDFPAGLDAVYQRMLQHILESPDANGCKDILKIALTVYRPINLEELTSLLGLSADIALDMNTLEELIQASGSFLMLRNDAVYFIHQSARDFLTGHASTQSLGLDRELEHHAVFSKCLRVLTKTLRQNIYGLNFPGFPIGEVQPPQPDPLASIRYCCTYWASHLSEAGSARVYNSLSGNGSVIQFFQGKILNWLEALCLMHSLPSALQALKLLENLSVTASGKKSMEKENQLSTSLIRDALRFIRYFKPAIEAAPLQIYSSGLTFSPERSLLRRLYHRSPGPDKTSKWSVYRSSMQLNWSPRIQTIDVKGDGAEVWLAATQDDFLVCSRQDERLTFQKATATGVTRLGSHPHEIVLGVFSTDCRRFASLSRSGQVDIWDLEGETPPKTLNSFAGEYVDATKRMQFMSRRQMAMSFTLGNDKLVLANHGLIGTWDIDQATFSINLKLSRQFSGYQTSYALTATGTLLATGKVGTVEIWDLSRNTVIRRFTWMKQIEGFFRLPMAFSHDGQKLAIHTTNDLFIWDLNQEEVVHCKLTRQQQPYDTAVFTRNGEIALPCANGVHLWATNGVYLQTLEIFQVSDLVFSSDGRQVACVKFSSANNAANIDIWDVILAASPAPDEKLASQIRQSFISTDGQWLATVAKDCVAIWDALSAVCIRRIEITDHSLSQFSFSKNMRWIATLEPGRFIHIWDALDGNYTFKIAWTDSSNMSDRLTFLDDTHDAVAIWFPSGRIDVWDLHLREHKQRLQVPPDPYRRPGDPVCLSSLIFSVIHQKFALYHLRTGIGIYDLNTGSRIQTLDLSRDLLGTFQLLSFSEDGLRIVAQDNEWEYGMKLHIWKVVSGRHLKRLDVDLVPVGHLDLPFMNGFKIRTDSGVVDVDRTLTLGKTSRHNGRDTPRFDGYHLSHDRQWITKSEKKIIWIPHEFRRRMPAIAGNTVVLLHERGGFMWLLFSPD